MVLRKATEADYDEIIDLANLAYRGREGATPSWNIEKGILEGQRLDRSLLREELAAKPSGALLVYRNEPQGPLPGTAWLNPEDDGEPGGRASEDTPEGTGELRPIGKA